MQAERGNAGGGLCGAGLGSCDQNASQKTSLSKSHLSVTYGASPVDPQPVFRRYASGQE